MKGNVDKNEIINVHYLYFKYRIPVSISDETVGEMKINLSRESGIPIDRIILRYAGCELEDKYKLIDYDIQNESVMALFYRTSAIRS